MKATTLGLTGKSGLCVLIIWMLTLVSTKAAIYVYDFSHVISGTPPAGAAPWLRATFEDVSPGTVRLNFLATALTGSENVVKAYFNLNPTLNAENLSLTHSASVGSFDLPAINLKTDEYKADGDGRFDIQMVFVNDGDGDASRFTTGESVEYLLTYSDTLYPALNISAVDFNYLSLTDGGAGIYYTAAHVQRIVGGTETSGWIGAAVPEPSVAALFFGALTMLFLRRK